MTSFTLRLVLFVLLQAAIFGLAWKPDQPRQTNMLATTLDKHARLDALTRAGRPKVVLTGGSNVPFGFQSPLLEQLLGRPVVNMGIAAGLGAPFMLGEITSSLGAGDVAVLAFEYDLYESLGHALAQRQLLEFRPQSLRYVPATYQKALWDESLLAVAGAVIRRSWIASAPTDSLLPADAWYTRGGFNEWGDYTAHYTRAPSLPGLPADDPVFNPRLPERPSAVVLAALGRFADVAARRHARVALTWPPLPEEVYQRHEARLRQLAEAISTWSRSAPGPIEILGTPRDFAFPRSAFYDLTYHLHTAGAEQRTRRVAELLRPLLR